MKILIIKLGALGDIITSTSVVQEIVNYHGDAEIHLLTSSNFKDLFSGFNKLNIVSFNRTGLINKIKSILWIRKNKFDRI